MFYFFTRARVVVCSARAPFFLSQILTSIETLFAFFLCAFVFDLSLGSFLTYPSVLRWKTRASCGRKALKKLEALENARKGVPFFSFFLSLDCSLRDVTAAVFVVLAFSFLRKRSLSALVKFFLSLEGVEEDLPHTEPPPLQKRCLFSL